MNPVFSGHSPDAQENCDGVLCHPEMAAEFRGPLNILQLLSTDCPSIRHFPDPYVFSVYFQIVGLPIIVDNLFQL